MRLKGKRKEEMESAPTDKIFDLILKASFPSDGVGVGVGVVIRSVELMI